MLLAPGAGEGEAVADIGKRNEVTEEGNPFELVSRGLASDRSLDYALSSHCSYNTTISLQPLSYNSLGFQRCSQDRSLLRCEAERHFQVLRTGE
jgi:hypothetical protein